MFRLDALITDEHIGRSRYRTNYASAVRGISSRNISRVQTIREKAMTMRRRDHPTVLFTEFHERGGGDVVTLPRHTRKIGRCHRPVGPSSRARLGLLFFVLAKSPDELFESTATDGRKNVFFLFFSTPLLFFAKVSTSV